MEKYMDRIWRQRRDRKVQLHVPMFVGGFSLTNPQKRTHHRPNFSNGSSPDSGANKVKRRIEHRGDEKLGPVNLEEQRRGARGTQRMTKLTTRPSHSREFRSTRGENFWLTFQLICSHPIDVIWFEKSPLSPLSFLSFLDFSLFLCHFDHEKLRNMSTANITKGMCLSHMGNMCPTHTRANASRVCSTRSFATAIPLKLYARRVPMLNAFLE
ncbi:hypothetical protein ALC53_01271 [Atta colombica]|uniref:Uncharacterized protein n=1 Tax=Atta colombica TaxID=520822 RepID=A0A195BW63_9HYME|nr:hypothetical protein ALC53_01271 [Atta colombica]